MPQRHQQQKASGETELGCSWHEPDYCDLAREGGFHDAEHGLVIVDVDSRHAARDRHYQRHAKADRPKADRGDGRGFLGLNRGSLASRAPPASMSDLAGESPGSALGIIAVESSLPATFLNQRKYHVDRWCCDLDKTAQFLDGGDECIDL
jgi:hypothetical protein